MATYATYVSRIHGIDLPWFVWVEQARSDEQQRSVFARMCNAGWKQGGDPVMEVEAPAPGNVHLYPQVQINYKSAIGWSTAGKDDRGPYVPPAAWIDSLPAWNNRCLTLFGITNASNFNLQQTTLTQVVHLWAQEGMVAAMCEVVLPTATIG